MKLQESGEMYLETVLVLSQEKPVVRSIDVAESLGYSKPSVSRAVTLLKNGGYLSTDESGHLSLTDSGSEIANKIYERHRVLSDYLMQLGVSEDTAAEDACKMEHIISHETFDAIRRDMKSKKKKKKK